MKLFTKIGTGLKPLPIFLKSSILNVCLGPEHASEYSGVFLVQLGHVRILEIANDNL